MCVCWFVIQILLTYGQWSTLLHFAYNEVKPKKKRKSDFSGIWSITALSWCYFGDITQRQILQLGFRASSFQSVSFQDFFPFTVLSSLISHCSIYTTCSLHFFGVRFVRLPSSIVQQYLIFFPLSLFWFLESCV